ncbi:uncharacterized protein LOC105186862 [Harpegnathos saltator]|uniref:uncharacterized protein LOC105186862 n=1 Tax=Harpegnathos saltator TaxID=610380 RepID=UPI0005912074|nr:uncharacterized protein LOC105186862 [Harpegnathos saltator]
MKRTLMLLFAFVVAAMSNEEVEKLAENLEMSIEDLQKCFNKSNTVFEELTNIYRIVKDNMQTTNFDEKALRIGCFVTCFGQNKEVVKGTNINIDKFKNIVYTRLKWGERINDFPKWDQMLDTCYNQVKSETDECKLGIKATVCYANEMGYFKNDDYSDI